MKSPVLVTGGAGYIGSHTVNLLAEAGERVVVLDNLVYGHRDAILRDNVTLVEGEMADRALVESLFKEHQPRAVIHFAAYAYVGESVTDPGKYYRNNMAAPLVLLDVMKEAGCNAFIFSSTCATYGNPQSMPMDEKHPQDPINPYGMSKLMLERVLIDYDHAHDLRSVRLRYFNASGADPEGRIGEDHRPETHLIPLVLEAVQGKREHIIIFGDDYPTPDGTCVRDYIHILDLARAHQMALDYLERGGESVACNLGTGTGTSVREIISLVEDVTGKPVPVKQGERRAGDPPELVANPALAKEVLGWSSELSVRDAIKDAWNWVSQEHGGRFPS